MWVNLLLQQENKSQVYYNSAAVTRVSMILIIQMENLDYIVMISNSDQI